MATQAAARSASSAGCWASLIVARLLTSGYADPRRARLPALGSGRAGGAQSVTIAPKINIKVEGGSRGESADADLAKRIGREVEGSVCYLVVKELLQQKRPGGILTGQL